MRDRYERKHRVSLRTAIARGNHDSPRPAMSQLFGILEEVNNERRRAADKWGDKFDDANSEQDWAAFIMYYTAVGITSRLGAAPGRPFREAMLKVATLAVSAIEAHDRKEYEGEAARAITRGVLNDTQ